MKAALVNIRDMADKEFDIKTVNALLIAYRNGKLFETTEDSLKTTGD